MQHGLHHVSKRKNFPHKEPLKKFVDYGIYFFAIFGPFMALPQSIKIFYLKSAESVSLLSFIGFVIYSLFWVLYGVVHKDKPIIITNILWALVHSSVIVGILIYG